MIVSNAQVKRFLLDLINQSSFPGNMSEFVTSVKIEVAQAKIEAESESKKK